MEAEGCGLNRGREYWQVPEYHIGMAKYFRRKTAYGKVLRSMWIIITINNASATDTCATLFFCMEVSKIGVALLCFQFNLI